MLPLLTSVLMFSRSVRSLRGMALRYVLAAFSVFSVGGCGVGFSVGV